MRRSIFRITSGNATPVTLCMDCAVAHSAVLVPNSSFDPLRFFCQLTQPRAGFVAFDPAALPPGLACSGCGLTFAELTEGGRLGCATCYQTFKEVVIPALDFLHA